MKRSDLIFLARLRLFVGYLGEQNQFAWWPCSFYAEHSKAFLAPVFGKTLFLTQYYGIKEAATKVHDNYIGVGRGVFHLFRLPETIEQELHTLLCDAEIAKQLTEELSGMTDVLKALELCGDTSIDPAVGPVRVGGLPDIEGKDAWQVVASHYRQSFATNNKVFPFFSEGNE